MGAGARCPSPGVRTKAPGWAERAPDPTHVSGRAEAKAAPRTAAPRAPRRARTYPGRARRWPRSGRFLLLLT
ncbi:unnamed protein product [Pipistrellus nathusii]|uniref:Uncharacterized protein n=1 Tax=Pipistrellus nathusii TaxID=59473 RepID=A0ABP0A6S1_PIPNA